MQFDNSLNQANEMRCTKFKIFELHIFPPSSTFSKTHKSKVPLQYDAVFLRMDQPSRI